MQTRKNTLALTVIVAMMAVYTVVFSYASIMRWASFNSSMDDMGIMIQTLHNTSQGELLVESVNLGVPLSRLWLAHLEFIYIPLALVYKLIHRPETLLVLQSLFLALGAMPVYWLARDRFSNVYDYSEQNERSEILRFAQNDNEGQHSLQSQIVGIVFAAAYLLYPAIHNANLFDVHGIVFSTSLLLYMFYFLDRVFRGRTHAYPLRQAQDTASREGKYPPRPEGHPSREGISSVRWFFLFAFLALLCREDIAVTLGMVGLYIFFVKRDYKLGVITGVVGAVWFGMFYFVRPMLVDYFNPVDPAILANISRPSHWAHLDGGRLILERPLFFLDEYLLTGLNAQYIFWLLAPVAFLSLASPATLAIAAPILLINMTSGWLPTHLIEYQYTATVTPVVFVSAIYGLENLRRFAHKCGFSAGAVQKMNLACLGLIVLLAGGASFAKSNLRKLPEWQVTPRHETISRIAKMIPEEASLSADMTLGTHAAERSKLYAFPDNYRTADYVFYDLASKRVRLMSWANILLSNAMPVNDYFLELLHSPEHGVAYYEDGIVLIQRGFPRAQGIRHLAIAQEGEIANFVRQPVDSVLAFVGYTVHQEVEYDDSTFFAHFTLYWQKSDGTNGAVDAQPRQFVIESGGEKIEAAWQPAFGLYPFADWQGGEIVREHVYWPGRTGPVAVSLLAGSSAVRLFSY